MKAKTRLEYIDQFRKINTLQKLPPLKTSLMQLFQQQKQQNNKFIRFRQQPQLNQQNITLAMDLFINNIYIQQFRQDSQQKVQKQYQSQNNQVKQFVNQYTNLSDYLSQNLRQKNYKYKFFYKFAQPPIRISPQSIDDKATKFQISNQNGTIDMNKQSNLIGDGQNLFLNKQKYNFNQINKKLFQKGDQVQIQKKKQASKVKPMQQLIRKYQNIKTLDQISQINQFNFDYKDFMYTLAQYQKDPKIDKFLQKYFIVNSVIRKKKLASVQYLRDLGLPSRDILTFIKQYYQKLQEKQISLNSILQVASNIIQQSKQQTHYLHLLTPLQVNINKQQINFFDIMNISTGRLTNTNAYLCVRNDKVTRAQYQKAVKKLQKYHKMQRQGGKVVHDAVVQTDQVIESTNQDNNNQKTQKKIQKQTKTQLINQINQIRQIWQQLVNNNQQQKMNKKIFDNQIQKRLTKLITQLYQLILLDFPQKYPLSQLSLHIDQLTNKYDKQGLDNKRLLWFVMNTYQEILKIKQIGGNLRDLLKKNKYQQNQPVKNKFKDKKLVNIQKVNKLHSIYDHKNKARSKSPIPIADQMSRTPNRKYDKNDNKNQTPTKDKPNKNTLTKTPIKTIVNRDRSPILTNKKYK